MGVPREGPNTEAALQLQRGSRFRARAQNRARTALSKLHPKDYARLYQEAKRELLKEEEGDG